MTRVSQNGWPAKPDTSTFVRGTARCKGGDLKFWAANDDVAVVFKRYIERHDREVEDVVGPVLDDWSYANRLVRGSAVVVSNHGSATAIDLNALKYPLGTTNMTTAKLSAMRAIRRAINDNSGRPVLRLGADYVGRKDQMHIEIDADPAKVKQAADRIRAEVKDEDEMTAEELLNSKVTLSETAARAMGRKVDGKDNVVSVSYLIQWGGPAHARLVDQVEALQKALMVNTTAVVTLVERL